VVHLHERCNVTFDLDYVDLGERSWTWPIDPGVKILVLIDVLKSSPLIRSG